MRSLFERELQNGDVGVVVLARRGEIWMRVSLVDEAETEH